MSQVREEAELLLKGFNQIADVPTIGGNSEFHPNTSQGIWETIKNLKDFIANNEPGGFIGLNKLLSEVVVRNTRDISNNGEFSIEQGLKNTLKGKAGEHFVAGELFRRNTIVALPPQNTPLFDLIVTNPEGSKTVMVQVKTTMYDDTYGVQWQLNTKFTTKISRNDLFVVLVDARKQPEYFIFAYNDLVDIVNSVLKLPLKKTGQSGDRIFFSLADTFEVTISEKFYNKKTMDWKVILDYLK